MSIEIVIYPERGTRKDYEKLLLGLGYRQVKSHFMFRQSPRLSHYQWFDSENYESLNGVEANIIPNDDHDDNYSGESEYIIHTRTRMLSSYFDLHKQDETIRQIRRKFGGRFYNDYAGINRYINPPVDPREPIGRGIYIVYIQILGKIDALTKALPQPLFKPMEDADDHIKEMISNSDPSRVIYNVIPAFCVAALESFFSDVFVILLRFDTESISRMEQQNKKLEFREVIPITQGNMRLEEVVANWYSFQNILQIERAYKEWFNINLFDALGKRKKVSNRVKSLHEHYQELIDRRHDFIHCFDFDTTLDTNGTLELLRLVSLIMQSFVQYIEKHKDIQIFNPDYPSFIDV